jgi:hypothetical protein
MKKFLILIGLVSFLCSSYAADTTLVCNGSDCVETKTVVVEASIDLDTLYAREEHYARTLVEIDEETARDAARNADNRARVVSDRSKNLSLIKRLEDAGAMRTAKIEEAIE